MVALHTGQRQGDLREMQWSAYDGSALTIRQSKTGAEVYIPCTVALKTTLDDLKAERDKAAEKAGSKPSGYILTNSEGRKWTRAAFHTAWDRAFDMAWPRWVAVNGQRQKADPPPPDLHFHDIRGTVVTMLAEAQCTVPEIATITGHSLKTVTLILERYLSRTKELARSAIAKLEVRMAGATIDLRYNRELADAIEEQMRTAGDGMHLAPTDLMACVSALRLGATG